MEASAHHWTLFIIMVFSGCRTLLIVTVCAWRLPAQSKDVIPLFPRSNTMNTDEKISIQSSVIAIKKRVMFYWKSDCEILDVKDFQEYLSLWHLYDSLSAVHDKSISWRYYPSNLFTKALAFRVNSHFIIASFHRTVHLPHSNTTINHFHWVYKTGSCSLALSTLFSSWSTPYGSRPRRSLRLRRWFISSFQ